MCKVMLLLIMHVTCYTLSCKLCSHLCNFTHFADLSGENVAAIEPQSGGIDSRGKG